MNALEKQGIAENTITVFLSDHGDCLGSHEQITKNNFYEETMKIPLIINYPKKLKPKKNDMLISIPDLYPTLLSLMGLKNEIPTQVQGQNLTAQLTGSTERLPVFQLYFKIKPEQQQIHYRGLRNKQYTFAANCKENNTIELYLFDRIKDPHQLSNIAEYNSDLVKVLFSTLKSKLKEIIDTWSGNLSMFKTFPDKFQE